MWIFIYIIAAVGFLIGLVGVLITALSGGDWQYLLTLVLLATAGAVVLMIVVRSSIFIRKKKD